MPITYTNRNGVTYYLCQGTTRSDKPRYYFAREPKDTPVEQMPEGYEITESVNAVVSLAQARAPVLLPDELAAVGSAVKRHPKSADYRVSVRGKQILVYERDGPSVEEVTSAFSRDVPRIPALAERIQDFVYSKPRYSPVLRFTLLSDQPAEAARPRKFGVERWCFMEEIDGWLDLYESGPIAELAEEVVPKLGTDEFYELL